MFEKNCVSHIRMSKEEKDLIEKASKNEGKSLSDYVRTVIVSHVLSLDLKRNNSNDGINFILKQNEDMNKTLNKVFVLLVKLVSKDFSKEEMKEILESALKLAKNK